MNKAEIAGREPIIVAVTAGETYWWCACGKSKSQPFCDGSHQGSEFTPVQWQAEQDGPVAFCTCKQTDHAPRCDGNHKRIT